MTGRSVDIVVAGAGAVGLATAIALARAGFAVTVLGPSPAVRNGRTVALFEGSVRMMSALGVWRRLAGRTAPLETMRIVDDTGSLVRPPPVDFQAAEIGLPAFGYNVENADLVEALVAEAAARPGLVRDPALLISWQRTGEAVTVRTDAGETITGRLLVAADGAESIARRRAGIVTRRRHYRQAALTTILHHGHDHRNVSTEFHTREGPFTLVPLPTVEGGPHRSSLVWVMSPREAERRCGLEPDALAREVDGRARPLLGPSAIPGPVGRFPIRWQVAERLVAPRLALVGEAAHALPPIGAQGLNLSLRDAATLVDCLVATGLRGDPGAPAGLARYERLRTGDVALRAWGVDALNSALLQSASPADVLRGAGLAILGRVRLLRHAAMRHGLNTSHDLPGLMRHPIDESRAASS